MSTRDAISPFPACWKASGRAKGPLHTMVDRRLKHAEEIVPLQLAGLACRSSGLEVIAMSITRSQSSLRMDAFLSGASDSLLPASITGLVLIIAHIYLDAAGVATSCSCSSKALEGSQIVNKSVVSRI